MMSASMASLDAERESENLVLFVARASSGSIDETIPRFQKSL